MADQTAATVFARVGYPGFVGVAFAHAFTLMLRRSRLILAAVITLLPVLLPVALVFLPPEVPVEGGGAFVRLMEQLYLSTLAPALALFFATMLIGDDVEAQTIGYVLTRPVPRSAWVLGRYLAYCVLCAGLLVISASLVFAGCLALPPFALDTARAVLFAHYAGLLTLAVLAYGALCLFLGTFKRPIIYGVLLIFGWQPFAMQLPGLVDFLTLSKYIEALHPIEAEVRARMRDMAFDAPASQKVAIEVSDPWALATLLLTVAVFVVLTVVAVRRREYPASRAAGS